KQLFMNEGKPESGDLLISEPYIQDDNFRLTVIFLCENNESGSFGLVLNKPLELKINQAIQDFPDFEARLYLGGPVQTDTLHFLHTRGDLIKGGTEVIAGACWGGDCEELKCCADTKQIAPEGDNFCAGY